MMDGVEGIKTGFTTAAGYCLVSACVQNGIELYTVVFHSSSETQRFVDAKALLQWGFRHYRSFELINTSQQVAQMGLSSWIDKSVAVFVPNDVDLTLFDLDGPISQEIDVSDWSGAINAGDVCGTIIWTQNGQVIATSNLVAAASVAAPDFWSGIQIFFQRLFGNFTGAQKNEPTQVLLDAQLNVPVTQAPAD
jgi:D-alanyl-D-alanine carboxypeptidase (penicillin-binding protein 5/6)